MSARSIGELAEIVVERAKNLALLNAYLEPMPQQYKLRTILALHQAQVLSEVATRLLYEHHNLDAE